MPVIDASSYSPPSLVRNGHLQTIIPSMFRNASGVRYQRERLELMDHDFMDLDVINNESDRAVILIHGLEGDTQAHYMVNMAKTFKAAGYDVIAVNLRGCSGEPNKFLKSYHSGSTDDLHYVLSYVITRSLYEKVVLVGFSLGGNLIMKYLGERGGVLSDVIKGAAALSAPTDLAAGAGKINEPANMIYRVRFMRRLRAKLLQKEHLWTKDMTRKDVKNLKTLKEFDDYYTAPVHGFANADDYYEQCSSRWFIPRIQTPTLLINAKNDPFLPDACYPVMEAKNNANFYLEMPEEGGHVGFLNLRGKGAYWHEERILSFLSNV